MNAGVGLVLGFGLILIGGLLMVSGVQDRTLKEILKGTTSHHKKGEKTEGEPKKTEGEPKETPAQEQASFEIGQAGPPLKGGLAGPRTPLTQINPNPFSSSLLLPKATK